MQPSAHNQRIGLASSDVPEEAADVVAQSDLAWASSHMTRGHGRSRTSPGTRA